MYSRDQNVNGSLNSLEDDFLGADKGNHGIKVNEQAKYDHYDKGYKSIPAEHLISIQTAKYQGNK